MARPRVLVAGNLVEDRTTDGRWVPGGPALYAAHMANALGAQVTLVTRIPEGYPSGVLSGIDVLGESAATACRYANVYDAIGNRSQRLLFPGEPLDGPYPKETAFDVMIVAPAYHELDRPPAADARVVMVSLQGVLRSTGPGGRVVPAPEPLTQVRGFITPGAFASFSDEDTADPAALADQLAANGMVAIVTRGHHGATVHEAGRTQSFRALPANAVDPTGAGDCFAAAWAVRLAETGDLREACAFGLAAGSLATEGVRLSGVPTRDAVEQRARRAGIAGEVVP